MLRRNLSSVLVMTALGASVGASRALAAPSSMASLPWGTVIWEDSTEGCSGAAPLATLVQANIDPTKSREPIFVASK